MQFSKDTGKVIVSVTMVIGVFATMVYTKDTSTLWALFIPFWIMSN
jgi:hypothetical protein